MTLADERYLLDADAAHRLLQPHASPGLRELIRTTRLGSVWISAITEGELRRTLARSPRAPEHLAALEFLLRNVATVPFDRAAAIAYGQLLQPLPGFDVNAPELWVAAQALSTDSTLITVDRRYTAIPGLKTLRWN